MEAYMLHMSCSVVYFVTKKSMTISKSHNTFTRQTDTSSPQPIIKML